MPVGLASRRLNSATEEGTDTEAGVERLTARRENRTFALDNANLALQNRPMSA